MAQPKSAVVTLRPRWIGRAWLAACGRIVSRMPGSSWPLGLLVVASLLLLSACGILDTPKVKVYSGAPLPDSELSVLRGESPAKPQSNNVEEVTCWASVNTFAIDGATPRGEGGAGYSRFDLNQPPEPMEVAGGSDVDYYLAPGVHTIGVTTSYTLFDNRKGLEGYRTKYFFDHGRLQFDFKKGARYQIAVRIIGFRRLSATQMGFATAVWLQQVNSDGSVQDVAQFQKINRDRPGVSEKDESPGVLFR